MECIIKNLAIWNSLPSKFDEFVQIFSMKNHLYRSVEIAFFMPKETKHLFRSCHPWEWLSSLNNFLRTFWRTFFLLQKVQKKLPYSATYRTIEESFFNPMKNLVWSFFLSSSCKSPKDLVLLVATCCWWWWLQMCTRSSCFLPPYRPPPRRPKLGTFQTFITLVVSVIHSLKLLFLSFTWCWGWLVGDGTS